MLKPLTIVSLLALVWAKAILPSGLDWVLCLHDDLSGHLGHDHVASESPVDDALFEACVDFALGGDAHPFVRPEDRPQAPGPILFSSASDAPAARFAPPRTVTAANLRPDAARARPARFPVHLSSIVLRL